MTRYSQPDVQIPEGTPTAARGRARAGAPGPLTAIRAAAIVLGGPVALDAFFAAGVAATSLVPLVRPGGHGVGRVLRRLAGLGAAGAWGYALAGRPWLLRWGATDAEVDRTLPGDEIVPHARWRSTRAVTITAPAAAVWPWLVQIGQGRGGFYSYDWVENLAGLGIHSADRIVPELQDLAVGDFIAAAPGEPEAGGGWTVVSIDPGHALVLRVGPPSQTDRPATDAPFAATWAFVVEPLDEARSRLIARWRATSHPAALVIAVMALIDLPFFIMERKMLLGIKERAERTAALRG